MRKISIPDYAAIAIILLTSALIAYRNDVFPIFVDIYYHLSVMEMFDQAGGIVAYDFLQFAPLGRPHLYPPLLHLLMLAMDYAGISSVAIGQITSAVMYPLTLLSVWYFTRENYSKGAALFSVIILASSWQFVSSTSILSACALATICAVWTYHFILKGKKMAALILFALCLYSHLSYPHLIAASLLIWAAVDKTKRTTLVKVCAGAYLLASPWILNELFNLSSISSTNAGANATSVQLISLVLAIAGCIVCIRRCRSDNMKYAVPIAMLCVMVPISVAYPSRFLTHSAVPLAILGGIGAHAAVNSARANPVHAHKVATYCAVCAASIAMIFGNVILSVQQPIGGGIDENRDDNIIPVQDIYPKTYGDAPYVQTDATGRAQKYQAAPGKYATAQPPPINDMRDRGVATIRFDCSSFVALITGNCDSQQMSNVENESMLETIRLDTSPEDVVVVSNGMLGAYISAYTGRATTSGMFHETSSEEYMRIYQLVHQYDTYTIRDGQAEYIVIDMPESTKTPSSVPAVLCLGLLAIGVMILCIDISKNKEK